MNPTACVLLGRRVVNVGCLSCGPLSSGGRASWLKAVAASGREQRVGYRSADGAFATVGQRLLHRDSSGVRPHLVRRSRNRGVVLGAGGGWCDSWNRWAIVRPLPAPTGRRANPPPAETAISSPRARMSPVAVRQASTVSGMCGRTRSHHRGHRDAVAAYAVLVRRVGGDLRRVDRKRASLTANSRRSVENRQTSPSRPAATGPASTATSPRAKRPATSAAWSASSTSQPQGAAVSVTGGLVPADGLLQAPKSPLVGNPPPPESNVRSCLRSGHPEDVIRMVQPLARPV